MNALFAWLEATSLAAWVRESPSIWAYPTVLTLHTAGLGLVVGASAVLHLRLLGFGRRLALPALAGLFPILWTGLTLNAATGIMLFVADATTKGHQAVFYVKLALIAVALWTTLSTRRTIRSDHQGEGSARWSAVSLACWAGAITAGRLMAYL